MREPVPYPELMSTETLPTEAWDTELRPRRTVWRMGAASFALAAVLVAAEGVAIALASDRQWAIATVIAWSVIVLTVVSFFAGLAAVILKRGRRWGIAALVLSVVGNPLVLVWLFAPLTNS